MNSIYLNFDQTITRITGSKYGSIIYNEQIKPKIKDNVMNEIVFPENIKAIGISFVRGMMSEEMIKYGKQGLFEHFKFKCNNEGLEQKIIESINF